MPRAVGPNFPIVVTSYEVALSDAKRYLRHYSWKYLVVDEVTLKRLTIWMSNYTSATLTISL